MDQTSKCVSNCPPPPPKRTETHTPYPGQQVGVQDHQIGGHFCRDFDLVSLQLGVHAEQHVVSIKVAA